MICENLSVAEGELFFAGQSVKELAHRFGTPLYVMDEDRIRKMCRIYRESAKEAFGESATVLFAGKACAFKEMYRVMREENMGIDVVSAGEIYTARAAGFDLSQAYFHGNNKTDEDLRFALEAGVGTFVCDNREEMQALSRFAAERGKRQRIFLRITPGIDPHTYEEVATGKVDSKFGFAIETGAGMEAVKEALSLEGLSLEGFHCHVGSQVFEADVFIRSAEKMIDFILEVQRETGLLVKELDLGGGFGVRYVESDPVLNLKETVLEVGAFLRSYCEERKIPCPRILMEPGRSIVADAGMTLYTVGTVKKIPGYKNYVSVNGGMADNPRFALYGAQYTLCLPEKMEEKERWNVSVVGCCCESGDILQENVSLPASVKRGDLLAVLTTGAYNYSMASHYNRIPKPAVVFLKNGEARTVVQRESYEDLIRSDL